MLMKNYFISYNIIFFTFINLIHLSFHHGDHEHHYDEKASISDECIDCFVLESNISNVPSNTFFKKSYAIDNCFEIKNDIFIQNVFKRYVLKRAPPSVELFS